MLGRVPLLGSLAWILLWFALPTVAYIVFPLFALTQKVEQKSQCNSMAPPELPGQRTTVFHYRWLDALEIQSFF